MRLIRFILGLFTSEKVPIGATVSLTLSSGYNADRPIARIADRNLSDHFRLFEFTVTSNASLQEENRVLSDTQLQKLTKLSRFAEGVRRICGGFPIRVHSGYRCLALNGATLGSSSTSQHPLCEALDFDVLGQSLDETFTKLRTEAAAGRWQFGQLIRERANRGHVVSEWVHVSTHGSLPQEKIGQILAMKAGLDGVPHYELIEKMTFPPLTA